jgi:Gene product 88
VFDSTFPLPLVEGGPVRGAAAGPPDRPDRNLLVRGNTKLGEDVAHWDLPAVGTCPGRSHGCSGLLSTSGRSAGTRHCYMLRIYARRPSVRALHERNLRLLADLPEFQRRVLREVRRRRLRTIRWHVSGDIFSADYGRALLSIMAATPCVEHFLYTRSWRVPRLVPILEQMAALENVSVWYSCDATTGLPKSWPARVRLCWMALHAAEGESWGSSEDIARCHLVFMDVPLRRLGLATFAGTRVCPQERDDQVTCTSCRYCMPERLNADLQTTD